ncbi:MAG: prolyl oligopeptidase family serine peptidase [Gemmatimonadaceae bacterium]
MPPVRSLAAVFLLSTSVAGAQAPKRPLAQKDFDAWRAITGATLSNDGKWAVYSLVPQVGDGEIVVRAVPTGAEYRHSRGFLGRPETRAGAPPRTGDRAPAAQITADGKWVIFTIEPSRADVERAQREKKRLTDQPKNSLGLMSTGDGKVSVVERVRSFKLPKSSPRWLAYSIEPADTSAARRAARDSAPRPNAAAAAPGGQPRPVTDSTARAAGPKREMGSALVLRDLSSGQEIQIPDVSSYAFDDRGTWLAYTVGSKNGDTDGAFVRALGDGKVVALAAGKGNYKGLTFDKAGSEIAFVSDRDDFASKHPRFALYQAPLSGGAARAIVAHAAFGDSLIVQGGARIAFSDDGRVLEFGVAPPPLDSIPADSLADKAVFDLWNYKDARLQPQQKVEASRDRDRAYAAAVMLNGSGAGTVRVIGSDTLAQVSFSRSGRTALGQASLAYAIEAMWGEGGSDIYVVDVAAGTRKLVKAKVPSEGGPAGRMSPDGKYVAYYAPDSHWYAYSVATGKTADLTGGVKNVHFENEEWDTPSLPAPYGIAGWTKGDNSVLVYDRYDVWELDPAGVRAPRVVTDSVGRRQHITFRIVVLDTAESDGAFDPAKPILLRATDEKTKASGFWRDRIGASGAPVKLAMMDKQLSTPAKAKNADVYLFTEQTFAEFPDLYVSNGQFATASKISDANPQQQNYKWGSAELVAWSNADGVPLQGILFKPENFDASKKYPMVVYYYERLSENVHSYVPPAGRNVINPTVYVSNDYLVFEPDIVYKTGYPGKSAYNAIVPGVQALIAKGFVDEKNVGLQGQSWGGYQTAYVITQTNMFKAAMAGAPVANMTSAYGGIRWQSGLARAFQYEHTQSRIGGSIWDKRDLYLENSPLFYADKVQTPLLIMSNDGDGSVPWYQGIELFVGLRRFGKEVYLVDYNGDEHNPTKRANQLDIAMRMQQFFDHHLKGAPAPEWMEKGIPFLSKGRDQIAAKTVQQP